MAESTDLPQLPADWAFSGTIGGECHLLDRYGIVAMTFWPDGRVSANGVTPGQIMAGLRYFSALVRSQK